jgi:hypothetical protein
MGIVVGKIIQRRITWNKQKLENYDITPHKLRRRITYSLTNKFFLYNMPNSNKMIAWTFCRSKRYKHISSSQDYHGLEPWKMQKEPLVMREKPKANKSVLVM